MNFRNRRLLDLAHEINECTLQVPGVCRGYTPEGCEPVHANWSEYGKGGALKAHDPYFAAGCHCCHVEIDQGRRLSGEERKEYWRRGFERTVLLLWQHELVRVA